MKRTGNKNLKIVAATMMTIFSLFTCFSAAAAWFIGVRNQGSDVDGFEVKTTDGLLNRITVHPLIDDFEHAFIDDEYGFNIGHNFDLSEEKMSVFQMVWASDEDVKFSLKMNMGEYELLQQTNPLLILFHFNEAVPANEVTINATAKDDSTAYFDSDDSKRKPLTQDENPLSAITKFSSVSFASDILPKTSAEVEEDSSSAIFPVYTSNAPAGSPNKTSNPITFTKMTNEGVFDEYDTEATFYSSTNTTTIECIGIVIDYFSEAIDYLYYLNLGSEVISNIETGVRFNCDWTMVI